VKKSDPITQNEFHYSDLFQKRTLMINKPLSEFMKVGDVSNNKSTSAAYRYSQLLTPCLILIVILSSSYISLSALYYISTLKTEGK